MLKACSLTLESKDERIAELERENARLNEYEMVCEPCNAPYLGRRFSATSEGFSKCPTCGSFGVPKEIIDRQKLVSERDSALARVKALESHLSAQYKVLENQLGDLVSGEKENAKLRRLLDRHRANGHILTEELKAQS